MEVTLYRAEQDIPLELDATVLVEWNYEPISAEKYAAATAEEKAAFEELIGLGVDCWMQTTTRDSKEPVSELLKNY